MKTCKCRYDMHTYLCKSYTHIHTTYTTQRTTSTHLCIKTSVSLSLSLSLSTSKSICNLPHTTKTSLTSLRKYPYEPPEQTVCRRLNNPSPSFWATIRHHAIGEVPASVERISTSLPELPKPSRTLGKNAEHQYYRT